MQARFLKVEPNPKATDIAVLSFEDLSIQDRIKTAGRGDVE